MGAYQEEEHRQDGPRRERRPAVRLWFRALAVALSVFVFGCFYFFVRQFMKDGAWLFDLTLANKALGTTSLFLISQSMLLTGVAYFLRGKSRLLAHRKHYGLAGFWVGLVHGAVNHFLLPAVGLQPERNAKSLLSDAPGLMALIIFGIMAALSNAEAKGRMGGKAWRKLLRYGGYAGLILAAGHTALLKWGSWTNYLRTSDPALPSLSLPAAVFAAAAVLLRLAAWIVGKRKPRPTSTSPGL